MDNDATQKVAVIKKTTITRADIETMRVGLFTDFVVDLAMRGGEVIIDHFRAFLATEGPCSRDIGKRWHALAMLCMLYAQYVALTPEIEAIQALFARRVVDEELKLHR